MQSWLDPSGLRLGRDCPLPLDAPFLLTDCDRWGVSRHSLRMLERSGHVRRLLRGVYVATQAPDSLRLRAAALSLVMPPGAVVTDRTAAWLHGVDILPRGAHVTVPPLQVFLTRDSRLERAGVASGRRGLLPRDVMEVDGILTTTPLRTALDLGRLLWRYDALAALDGFLRIGVRADEMLEDVARFRGYRGVRQLRALVPLADGRAESPGESALRLNWYDAGLPRPELQWWVYDDRGVGVYRLDLALPEVLYAAEYDGEQFHTSPEDRAHDAVRRQWCASERGWHFEVFTKRDVYDRRPDPLPRLAGGLSAARRNVRWQP